MAQTKLRQEQLPVDTDGTMVANSDAVVPSQKAVVTFVNAQGGGGGGSGLVIYDDSVYKVTGTAISFDANIDVVVTGTTAFVSVPASAISSMSLIQEISPVGTGTASFQSIPQTYRHLRMEWIARGTQSATNTNLSVYFNNDSTNTNYRRILLFGYGGTTTVGADVGDDALVDSITAATAPTGSSARGVWDISYYKETVFYKTLLSISSQRRDVSTFQVITYRNSMEWENTSAINRIDIVLASGNFSTGTSFSLYGIT